MATRRRKFEQHRLTVSGLLEGTQYTFLVRRARRSFSELGDLVWEKGAKSHALYEATVVKGHLRMLFMSFRTGFRPDVLDVANFAVAPNPLADTQTGVEWTHVVGKHTTGGFMIVVEKGQGGIWPGRLEEYLQWLLTQAAPVIGVPDIVVNLEAIADETFLRRIDELERIQQATVRTVRPNPGWTDLEDELASEAEESAAGKVDVTMFARRNRSLARRKGIIGAIRERFASSQLGFARVSGRRAGKTETFDTERYNKSFTAEVDLDEAGQVSHIAAWRIMGEYLDNLD